MLLLAFPSHGCFDHPLGDLIQFLFGVHGLLAYSPVFSD